MTAPPPHLSSSAVVLAAASLRREREALALVGGKIEGDFVRLGELLGETTGACAKVSALAERLRRVARGDDEDRALVFAYQLFKKRSDLVLAGVERLDRVRRELSEVSVDIRALGARERDFSEVVTMFWLLKTSFRVEAATLSAQHQALLAGLTAGMDEIHDGLKQLVSQQFGRLEASRGLIASLDARLADVQVQSRAGVAAARSSLEGDLGAFARALAPAAQYSERVTGESARAEATAARVIVSLQFHDIVRQRVEHVVSAIAQVLGALESTRAEGAAHRDQISAAATAHCAARIQLEQLRDARGEIERAGETIVAGIGEVLESGAAVLDSGRQLQVLVAEGLHRSQASASFVNKIEQLRDSQGTLTQNMDALVALAAEVGRIVDELSTDVVDKTESLRLVALNAGVQAHRVNGAAVLERLAAITRQDADDVLGHTRGLLGRTRDLQRQLEQIGEILGEFLALAQAEDAALVDEAATARRLLDALRVGTGAVFKGIDRDFARMRADAQRTLEAVTFRETIAARFAATESALVALVEALDGVVDGTSAGYVERLASMRAQYTMEREREMHDVVAASSAGASTPRGAPRAEPGAAAPPPAVDFELF